MYSSCHLKDQIPGIHFFLIEDRPISKFKCLAVFSRHKSEALHIFPSGRTQCIMHPYFQETNPSLMHAKTEETNIQTVMSCTVVKLSCYVWQE